MAIDLNVLPLYRQDGQDRSDFPGLYLVTPPRRTARGRDADRLILHFTMLGNAPLEDAQILPLLQRLAQLYYKVPGSITSAMRASADHLNLFLLDRNLRGSSTGRQGTGILIMAVVREDRLTLAHCGPAHTYLITSEETQDLHDSQGNRGLGLTRAVAPRYFQATLHPNDLLVFVAQPPPAWTALTLPNLHMQGADTLRRRLLSQAGDNLSAAIAQVQVGTGKLRILRPKPPVQMATPKPTPAGQEKISAEQDQGDQGFGAEASPEATAEIIPPGLTGEEPGVDKGEGIIPDVEIQMKPDLEADGFQTVSQTGESVDPGLATAPDKPVNTVLSSTEALPGTPALHSTSDEGVMPGSAIHTEPMTSSTVAGEAGRRSAGKQATPSEQKGTIPPEKPSPARRALPAISLAPFVKGLSPVGRFLQQVLNYLSLGLHALLKRMLPDESLFNIPASTMIFVAVAVAVIIATTGGAVYFQRGRQIQFAAFFDQARLAAEQTQGQTDPNELRTGWETVLDFLDRADLFGTTTESIELRDQAQSALDQLDAIQRLDFQPAIIGGLSSQVHVVRLVIAENDLYLLNSNGGNVLRALHTGRGYEIDLLFECGPNPQIGPLIDITAIPKGNEFGATILGMDARGNLMYCIPGDTPVSRFPNIPQASEQGMRAFDLDSGDLYVLDPGNNSVWVYRNMNIDDPPNEYFSANRPDDVQGTIDMAVTDGDVYLLNKDGYIVKCSYGGFVETPTRCEDPALFNDSRPGRKNGAVILDARFDQLLITASPEASLYILDPVNQSIYRFGLRLKFIRQFRARETTPGAMAPAFAVSQNRTIYQVVGNQVYWATIP